ncbi:MAG: hypothetical protein AABY26_01830 [Nanoarchaeota archaeon]
MDFDQWRIGNFYTPSELTTLIHDAIEQYQVCFTYVSKKSPKIQNANSQSEICSLEQFVKEKFTSLELEFMRRSPAAPEEQVMNYLWMKLSLADERYKLHSSIKSKSNLHYLRQKPQVWGAEEAEADLMERL